MVTVKSGDNLAVIFKRINLSAKQLQNILALGNVTKPLKSMHPGKKIHFSFGAQDELLAIVYPIDTTTQLKITKTDGKFTAEQEKRSLETRVTYADATIQNSLYQAARRVDLTDKQIMQLSKIFAWDIDFSRQIRSGDQVKVLYEEHFLDGKKVRNGNILAAIVNHRGKDYRAVYFKDNAGNSGFYSPDGKNLWEVLYIKAEDILFDNPYFQHTSKTQKGCQIDYFVQTKFNTYYLFEIKFSRKPITSNVIKEVQQKIDRLKMPRGSVCLPVLIHVNGISESIVEKDFFFRVIDFKDLLIS